MPQTASIGPFAARNRGAMSQVPAASACSFPKATGNPPQLQIGARERGRRKFLNQRVARAVRVPGSKHEARVAGDESRTRAPNIASDCGAASSNPSAPRSLHPALRSSSSPPPTCSPCFPALPALPAPCPPCSLPSLLPAPLVPCLPVSFIQPGLPGGRGRGMQCAVETGNQECRDSGIHDVRPRAVSAAGGVRRSVDLGRSRRASVSSLFRHAAREKGRELFERHEPAADSLLPQGVEARDGHVEQLEHGIVAGEVATVLDQLAYA
jgi:hypothetical protein